MGTEQQETTTEHVAPEQGSASASREDLIAAVRAAGGTESVDVEAEESAAAEPAASAEAAAAPTEPAADPDEPRIASILRAREKSRAEHEAARNHAQELIEQARHESERMLRDARERAEREWQEDMARRRAEFAASPTAALRALGDPQQIVDAVVREGSPEQRAIQQLQKELAETKQKAAVGEDVQKQLADLRAEKQREAEAAEVAQVRNTFMGGHATAEKAPHLHARYDENEIFERANKLALSWKEGGLRLVRAGSPKGDADFDFDDVVGHLENDSKKRLAPFLKSNPAQQVSAGAPAKEPGNAPKVQANGTRTLSAAQGSERRTSPKPLSEMSPAEQRAALIEEVAAARRANPDAVY